MSERRKFLLEVGRVAAACVFMAACEQEQLAGPRRCSSDLDDVPNPAPAAELKDIYIVDGFTGLQLGTNANPYSVRDAGEFDALMRFLVPNDYLAVHYSGNFKTAGVYRWYELASRNLGKGWTVDGDAEISIDPGAISDEYVDGQPLYVLAGPARSVSGITTIGSHSALADRWKARGKVLRTGSVLLEADASIDRQTAKNFGSLGAETFVREIVGSGSITNSTFADYDPASSDDQVTVNRVMGVHALHEGNVTYASGDNQVQAHTIYLAQRGLVRNNKSFGARVFYYADYFQNKGLGFVGNECRGAEHAVQLKLSPAGDDFSHQDYWIAENDFQSWGANVSLDTCGPPTPRRFIRNIRIHPSLSVENVDNRAEFTRDACRMAA